MRIKSKLVYILYSCYPKHGTTKTVRFEEGNLVLEKR